MHALGTVKNHLSNIKKMHELGSFQYPSSISNLKHAMESLEYELARPIKRSKPIDTLVLARIYNFVDLTDTFEIVCYTALVTGFYLFMRKSNLVPDSRAAFDGRYQLVRSDIRMDDPSHW